MRHVLNWGISPIRTFREVRFRYASECVVSNAYRRENALLRPIRPILIPNRLATCARASIRVNAAWSMFNTHLAPQYRSIGTIMSRSSNGPSGVMRRPASLRLFVREWGSLERLLVPGGIILWFSSHFRWIGQKKSDIHGQTRSMCGQTHMALVAF